jgi:hypothetical protein
LIPVDREENVAANIVVAQKEWAETTCTFYWQNVVVLSQGKERTYLVGSWDLHNIHFFYEGLTF